MNVALIHMQIRTHALPLCVAAQLCDAHFSWIRDLSASQKADTQSHEFFACQHILQI